MQIQISASADTDVKNSTGKTVQANALDKNGKKIVVPIPRGKVVRMKDEGDQHKLWIVGTRAYFYLTRRKVAEFVRSLGGVRVPSGMSPPAGVTKTDASIGLFSTADINRYEKFRAFFDDPKNVESLYEAKKFARACKIIEGWQTDSKFVERLDAALTKATEDGFGGAGARFQKFKALLSGVRTALLNAKPELKKQLDAVRRKKLAEDRLAAPKIKVTAAGDWSAEEEVVKKLKLPPNAKTTKKQRNFVVDWELNGVFNTVKAKFDAIVNNAKSAGFKKTVSNSDGDEYKHAATGLILVALAYPGAANKGTARIQVHKYLSGQQVAPAEASAGLKDARALLKKLKMPAGTQVTDVGSSLLASWRKRGGHAGANAIERVRAVATALGFSSQSTTRHDVPDGSRIGSGSHYEHASGATLDLHSSYGGVASDNSFSITFTWKGK